MDFWSLIYLINLFIYLFFFFAVIFKAPYNTYYAQLEQHLAAAHIPPHINVWNDPVVAIAKGKICTITLIF